MRKWPAEELNDCFSPFLALLLFFKCMSVELAPSPQMCVSAFILALSFAFRKPRPRACLSQSYSMVDSRGSGHIVLNKFRNTKLN